MTEYARFPIVIVLVIAILGVIGYKLSPWLRPKADLTLPVAACNPGLQVCTATLPDGGQLELSIEPRPIRALQTLSLNVAVSGLQAKTVEIDFDGTQMKMGYNRPSLTGSNGRFTGQTILPVCVTGSMQWAATVLISTETRTIAVPFHFKVAGRTTRKIFREK